MSLIPIEDNFVSPRNSLFALREAISSLGSQKKQSAIFLCGVISHYTQGLLTTIPA